MKATLAVSIALLVLTLSAGAQTVSNETLQALIRSARAEKNIELTFDAGAGTSKLMAISENFTRQEASRNGITAMNFAIGFIYPGDRLERSPDPFVLTFWVMSKKPRFGEDHSMTVALPDEMLVIGTARYVAKPAQEMEYLNFEISRASLAKIAAQSDVHFMLGDREFKFTRGQMKLIADMLAITEVGKE